MNQPPTEPGVNLAEHKLLITMFARQAILIKTLADILRRHRLLNEEDIAFFDSFAPPAQHALSMTAESYSEVAAKLGLNVPIKRSAN